MRNLLLVVFLIFIGTVSLIGDTLKPVLTIGDDSNDDTFFYRIAGAVMGPDKSIYIADRKGRFISKFKFDGTFVKRIGRPGKGPGDFLSVKYPRIHGNELFIMDSHINRICRTNLQMNKYDYIPLQVTDQKGSIFVNPLSFNVINDDTFIGAHRRYSKEQQRVFFLSRDGKLKPFPFNYMPGKGKIDENSLKATFFTRPIIGVNHQTKRILITAQNIDNPVELFMYDFKGKLLRRFTHKYDEKFQFPVEYMNTNSKEDDHIVFNLASVETILAYKDYFLVFMSFIEGFSEKCADPVPYGQCLVFTNTGQCVRRLDLGNHFIAYSVSPDGYLLGQRRGSDTEHVSVFKLKF